jgi:hypothetical protein
MVQKTLYNLMVARTHRLSTVLNADKIVLLENEKSLKAAVINRFWKIMGSTADSALNNSSIKDKIVTAHSRQNGLLSLTTASATIF